MKIISYYIATVITLLFITAFTSDANSLQKKEPEGKIDSIALSNIDYIEDATAFIWNNKICLLTNDNYGSHTGVAGRGILWQSDTPTDFKLADAFIGFLKTADYCPNIDLSKAKNLYNNVFKFERPGILMIDEKPAYFYGPSGTNLEGSDHTCSYVMKINL